MSISAIVNPVSIIAIGDIQLPAVVITEVAHAGMGILNIPTIIPIIIHTNMGLTKDFTFCPKVCLDPSDIRREGTPHI